MTRAALAHDQIYALMGLCSPEEATRNPVRCDLDPEEAYRTSAVSHAELHNDLGFLGLCTPVQRDALMSGPSEDLKTRPSRLSRIENERQYFRASVAIPIDLAFYSPRTIASSLSPSCYRSAKISF